MNLRRLIFPLSLSLALFLVVAAPSLAQRSQSQQQRVGVYLTPVLRSNQRISHTRVLYLPGQAATAITTKPSSGGTGGGSTKSGGGGKKGGGGSAACPTSFSGSYTVGCVVAPTTTVPEAEEEIAADPDPIDASTPTYVAAVSDFSLRGGYNTTKWAITTDSGGAWLQNFVPLGAQNQPETVGGTLWAANSDPDVAIDNSGNVYLSDLYLSSSAFPNGIFVSSSTIKNLSGGGNFSYTDTVPVVENTPSNNTAACEPGGPNPLTGAPGFCLADKPWIAVDNSTNSATAGTVYVVWDHFWSCYNVLGVVACNDGPDIYLSYLTKGATQWSAPIKLDPATSTIPSGQLQSGNIEGPQVAVGPDGTVYVAYEAFDPSNNTRWQYLTEAKPSGSGNSLSLQFSTPFVVTPGFQDLTFTSNYRVNSFPSLAIGPQSQVYLEYADEPSGNAQIEFDSCTGTPCTTSSQFSVQPVTTTDPGQEFFPAISVDSSGVIDTSWFDTRNSLNNTADFDVYAAFNSGSGFSPIARVTPTTINTGVATFIGDYAGIAVGALDVAHPVWNDLSETCGRVTCKLSGDMQSTTLTLP